MDACKPTAPADRPPAWFIYAIISILLITGGILLARNRIRAHWWAHQIRSVDDPAQRGYCVASLAAVGESALGAIRGLARDGAPDVRSLAIFLLARLPESARPSALDELTRLLGDADPDVRDAAATALGLMPAAVVSQLLAHQVESKNPDAAAAALVGLSRLDLPTSLPAMCRTAVSHARPMLRAQAVELLGNLLLSPLPPSGADPAAPFSSCDAATTLAAALKDDAVFTGRLFFERQIDNLSEESAGLGRLLSGAEEGAPDATHPTHPRAVSDIAAATCRRLLGLSPTDPLDQTDGAEIADRLRRAIAAPRESMSLPPVDFRFDPSKSTDILKIDE